MPSFREILRFMRFLPYFFIYIKNPITYILAFFSNKSQNAYFYNGLIVPIDSRFSFGYINAIFFQKIYGQTQANWQTIVDIGANRGYFSLFAAQNLPNARIYAIEPFATTFQILSKNIHANHFESRIEPLSFAVSLENGHSPFYIGEDLLDNSLLKIVSDKPDTVLVETRSLVSFMDSYSMTHIDMLKMNCEGSEYDILMNTPQTYLQRIHHIRLEYHTPKPELTIDVLKAYLENQGFRCVRLKRYHVLHGIVWFERTV